jgi:antitoxin component of RelBE/YafQ-DinJ toxin-antitoxin module
MARPKLKQHKQRVNLTLDIHILEQAKHLADHCGMSLSKLVEIALELEMVTKALELEMVTKKLK